MPPGFIVCEECGIKFWRTASDRRFCNACWWEWAERGYRAEGKIELAERAATNAARLRGCERDGYAGD